MNKQSVQNEISKEGARSQTASNILSLNSIKKRHSFNYKQQILMVLLKDIKTSSRVMLIKSFVTMYRIETVYQVLVP